MRYEGASARLSVNHDTFDDDDQPVRWNGYYKNGSSQIIATNRTTATMLLHVEDDTTATLACSNNTNPEEMRKNRTSLNYTLPEGLTVTARKGRWYLRDNNQNMRWVFYNNFPLIRDHTGQWKPVRPVPTPNKAGVAKPIQRMVKRWATTYNVENAASGYGMCGLCVVQDSVLTATTLDNGIHERQHLLEHLLSRTLPHEFMWGILNAGVMAHRKHDLLHFTAATYTLAMVYAYNLLRSTDG